MTDRQDSTSSPAKKRILAFHPLLLGVFPVISLLAFNRHEAHLSWALVPVAIALAMSIAAWSLFSWMLGNWAKGAIPASLAMLGFFSFGHLVAPLAEDRAAISQSAALAPALIGQLTLLLAVCVVLHRVAPPRILTRFANLTAIVALAVPILSLVKYEFDHRLQRSAPAIAELEARPRAQRPDIYLIIPDAHARGDVMRDVYGYDPEPFQEELESMGFAVARQSTANYSMTPVSLASMLNFRYVEEAQNLTWGDLSLFSRLIRDSALESLVVEHGYKTVAFPSGAAYSEMRHFDQYHQGLGAARGFYRMVADLTPLSALLEDSPGWNALLSDRDRILRTLEDLPKIAHDPDPTFTFVHLSLPHPPFQFGENGEDVYGEYRTLDDDGVGSRRPEAQEDYPEAYRRQAIYTDRRLLDVVRGILANSDCPPVILIISDHGPRLRLHWRDAELTDARETLGNLTAVYLPADRASQLVYPSITPVNVVRVALNEALGVQLPLLKDRAYLSTNVEEMHHIADVTDRLQTSPLRRDPLAGPTESPSPIRGAGSDVPAGEDKWSAPVDAAVPGR